MKTFLIPIFNGFCARYILQTEIIQQLIRSKNRIVLLLPDEDTEAVRDIAHHENVFVERYDFENCRRYLDTHPLARFLQTIRQHALNSAGDIRTVQDAFHAYLKDYQKQFAHGLKRWVPGPLKFLVKLAQNFRLVRNLILMIEQNFYAPRIHQRIFDKYQPDLLVVLSLGTFDYDQFLMREARACGVKVASIVLSWDNTTTRGMPGATPDHVIAWTENMKQELIQLNDIPAEKIYVGGVAHFDHYYQENTFIAREPFFASIGADPDKKIIFFVTKSPNGYAWNHDIAKTILKNIRSGLFGSACQLVVRLHPIYFRRSSTNGYFFAAALHEFEKLEQEYPELILNRPEMISDKLNYSMPTSEISFLASLLKYSSLVINIFSTLNLESAIFDKPIINICYDGRQNSAELKARYDIAIDEFQTHNQRIIKSGGITLVRSEQELIANVDRILNAPELGAEGRRIIREEECGPNPGNAGKQIGDYLLSLI